MFVCEYATREDLGKGNALLKTVCATANSTVRAGVQSTHP